MRVLRGCKMISLDTCGGKNKLLGFLLLVGYMPLVWTTDYSSSDATSFKLLNSGDKLVSSPNQYFEFGIFNYSDTLYFLSIRYAPPIDQVVTWIAERDIPLTRDAVLQFDNGNLQLSDPSNRIKRDDIWHTTNNMHADSVYLLDTGKLVLKKNGTEVWNSFDDDFPTDTLLPGQHMRRNKGHNLKSWQRTGDPRFANDTYSFGWNAKGVLILSWSCPYCYLDWKGGPYIPALDVYAAHTIQNMDDVYFHEELGHLYINSDPAPTAILSGGPDRVNTTTLKRITMSPDGGLRIFQYTINQTVPLNQTANQSWKVMANWVVSDRPDSRTQCTAFGTCGQFSECISDFDSLDPVTCRCPAGFKPIYDTDAPKGCTPPNGPDECTNVNNNSTIDVGMLELGGVDMPWGGDYETLSNLPKDSSNFCKDECQKDCYCAGAVYSEAEHTCWKKNGVIYNLGYPTEALHGTDRISFLRNQTVPDYKKPWVEKDYKLVKILVPAIGVPGLFLIVVAIFYLWRNEKVQLWIPDCGSCCRRSIYEIKFPGEMHVRNEMEDGA